MENAQVDLIANGKAQGDVASQIMADAKTDVGFYRPFVHNGNTFVSVYSGSGNAKDPKSYQTIQINAATGTLRRDEWKTLDDAVLKISETRLNGIQSLITKGLTYNLGNAMGTTVLEMHDSSDTTGAEMTMDGVSRSKGDRQVFGTTYLPIPIIHMDYEINARVLSASRKMGNGLDVGMAERAARKVSEKLEDMLFTNETYAFGGGTIYSYLNQPQRNIVALGTDWGTATGAVILAKVLAMKQASIDALHYGPWELYIPTAYETVMDKDYDTSGTSTQTIRDRILKIGGITDVKVVDTLTAANVLLVQMTSDVVRLVRGMGIQNVQWSVEGNFLTKYKVMTIQVPQIRADQSGNSGIVHAS